MSAERDGQPPGAPSSNLISEGKDGIGDYLPASRLASMYVWSQHYRREKTRHSHCSRLYSLHTLIVCPLLWLPMKSFLDSRSFPLPGARWCQRKWLNMAKLKVMTFTRLPRTLPETVQSIGKGISIIYRVIRPCPKEWHRVPWLPS